MGPETQEMAAKWFMLNKQQSKVKSDSFVERKAF